MPLFEPYQPGVRRQPVAGLRVRTATAADIPAMARLVAQRHETGIYREIAALRGEFDRIETGESRKHFCTATASDAVVGFGRVTYLPADEIEGARNLPPGWYLTGVLVDDAVRRRGIGRALTARRIDWVRERADIVYYYASAENRTSIALHAGFGFAEVTRDIAFPGTTFTGGVGVLFALGLVSPSSG